MMKILVIGPTWIGDMVMSNSMYQLLIMKYRNEVKIDVMASRWNYAVVRHMSEVNKILFFPYTHGTLELIKCFKMGKFLKNERYHQAIILPNSFKSALIPFFAGIKLRTGWKGEIRYGVLNDVRMCNVILFPLLVQRYAALSYDANMMKNFSNLPFLLPDPRLNITIKEIEEVLFKFHLNSCTRWLVGLCVSSEFGPAKIWPHYHYIKLAVYLINCGYFVVILGSLNNQLICKFFENSILKHLKECCMNLINKTSLDEVISIIAACRGIVSNDSGLLHIACALQRPVVGLYGPTDPGFTPPLFNKSIVLRRIHGYYKIRKSDDNIYGYHSSLMDISPDQVLEAVQILFGYNV